MPCILRLQRMQYAYERPRLESVAQGNIFLCSLRKIQLYLIRLDGGVERDFSSLSFPSVWLVPPPEVEGEGAARSSIMVEIAPQCHIAQIRNGLTHFRACAKLIKKSVLLKVSLIVRPFLKFEYTISVVYGLNLTLWQHCIVHNSYARFNTLLESSLPDTMTSSEGKRSATTALLLPGKILDLKDKFRQGESQIFHKLVSI